LLHGIFLNDHATDRDHVAVYVVRAFRQTSPTAPNMEIREVEFFARDALPEGVSSACRARLAEVLDGAKVAEKW